MIAYHEYRVLMIDVSDQGAAGEAKWGVGDRVGLFLAINLFTNEKYKSEEPSRNQSDCVDLPLPPPPPSQASAPAPVIPESNQCVNEKVPYISH